MITWPKPNQYGYDTNGFKKLIQNILVNKVVSETDECNRKKAEWESALS